MCHSIGIRTADLASTGTLASLPKTTGAQCRSHNNNKNDNSNDNNNARLTYKKKQAD